MYCHDPKMLAEPARRLRTQRFFSNSMFVLGVLGIAVGTLLGTHFSSDRNLRNAFSIIFVIGLLVVVPRGFVANWRFRVGSIPCPCCGAPFTVRYLYWVPSTCGNCGFNCVTMHRPGDF